MKLKKFKERNKKEIGVFVFTILCILLVCGAVFFRTFAIFEVKTNQNVIKGNVQDPGNLYFAFYVDDKIQKDLPSKMIMCLMLKRVTVVFWEKMMIPSNYGLIVTVGL